MNRLSLSVVLTILCSSPLTAQWVQMGLSDRGIGEIAVGSSGLFAITIDSGSVYRSTDGGANWLRIVQSRGTHIAVAANGTTFLSMAAIDNSFGGDSLYRSTDGGNSWTNLHMVEQIGGYGNGDLFICVAVAPSGCVFCGLDKNILCETKSELGMSTDNGSSWTTPGGDTLGGACFAFRGNSMVTTGWLSPCEGYANWLLFSSDCGQTWIPRYGEIQSPFVWCSNGNILGSSYLGRFMLTTDTGASYSEVSTLFPSALLALPHGGVLVGTDTTGIYLFSDNGDSLGTINQGLTDLHIRTFAMDAEYVYVGTNSGVWRRPLTEVDPRTGIAPTVAMPTTFHLAQNYPNPFNPSTTIKFELPQTSHVTVTVYDILGREVSVLVNERRDAGVHEVKFDGSNIASGVYFYRIEAGEFVQAKQMLILK